MAKEIDNQIAELEKKAAGYRKHAEELRRYANKKGLEPEQLDTELEVTGEDENEN